MQEQVIIYLSSEKEPSPTIGLINTMGELQYLTNDKSDNLRGKTVQVILPAVDVLLTEVMLPKMSRSHLRQALPHALEEQLADDIDNLHIVPVGVTPEKAYAVAIVSKEKMTSWLTVLQSFGIQPDMFVPEQLLLPFQEGECSIYLTEKTAVVRTGLYSGFACDYLNVAQMLTLLPQTPQCIRLKNFSQHKMLIPETFNVDEIKENSTHFFHELAQNIKNIPTGCNLLQQDYTSKKMNAPRGAKLFKAACTLLSISILLLFLYPAGSLLLLKTRVNDLNQQINQIYKRNFPLSTSIVAPKMRMQEKFQKLTAEPSENHLLLLLGLIGQALKEVNGIQLKRLDFQMHQLTLDIAALSSDNFSSFTEKLKQQGLKVKQQNANLVGTQLNASVLVE